MNTKFFASVFIMVLGVAAASPSGAQVAFQEDFTGAGNANSWYFVKGACLTAGTSTSLVSPGVIPSCASIMTSYYSAQSDHDPYLVGGEDGYLGSATPPSSFTADPLGYG